MDIIKCKKHVYAIANTSADKSLVYQSLPVIIKGLVFIILSIIALMKDQIYITPKILYNHYLHLTV